MIFQRLIWFEARVVSPVTPKSLYLVANEKIICYLLCSTYVDDIISGAHADERAFNMY